MVGARGWIGRTLLSLLREALGDAQFAERVFCFGSAEGEVRLADGVTVTQRALARLGDLPPAPTILFHLAFLTKDKVAGMDPDAYVAANRNLSALVSGALDVIGVDRLFVASSGAAAFADDPKANADLRLYGKLKCEDENSFSAWAERRPALRRAVIGRIYSVSGPWMNKHENYALASFILDALAGREIEVRAPMRVFRSYVAVRELLSLVVMTLLDRLGGAVLSFSTGGEPLELGDVATQVAKQYDRRVLRCPVTSPEDNLYVGDCEAWLSLLARYELTHLALEGQIAETAAWLEREVGREPSIQAG